MLVQPDGVNGPDSVGLQVYGEEREVIVKRGKRKQLEMVRE